MDRWDGVEHGVNIRIRSVDGWHRVVIVQPSGRVIEDCMSYSDKRDAEVRLTEFVRDVAADGAKLFSVG